MTVKFLHKLANYFDIQTTELHFTMINNKMAAHAVIFSLIIKNKIIKFSYLLFKKIQLENV
jgi:hypothetical protein